MGRIFILALTLTCALAAQEKYPLREIVIEGAQHFDKDRIQAETGLHVGDMVNEADFQKAVARLTETGVFETLSYRFGPKDGGYSLTFEVDEVDQVFSVRFLNFDEPEPQLLEELHQQIPLFKTEVPATGRMVDQIGDALQKRWMAAGHDSRVIGQLLPIDGESLAMVFQPEQRMQSIAFVEFKGSAAIGPLDLQRSFNPKAMGEPYTEARLLQLLQYNVRPMYEEKGFMGVEFCPCEARPDDASLGLIITVEVHEGDVYSYGSIQRPDVPPVSPDKLDSLFDFSSGERVNMTAVQTSLGRLDELLRTVGFLKSQTLEDHKVHDDTKTVDLVFHTELGPQYTFRRLEIQGLDILAEPVVRKRWGLEPGRPFNATYPRFFLDTIEQEGMFEHLAKTEARTHLDETTKTVDVTLIFNGEDRKKGYIPEAQRPKNPNDPF